MENCLAWQPSASIETLQKRAALYAKIRQFFTKRGYLEVETPILGRYGITDLYLSNIKTNFRGETYYLQTSPEYHMKRLLAAGSGPIFQLARVFRDDELGRWHNPEFTLLEWYQLNIDHHGLMDEMDSFLQMLFQCPPMLRLTYQQAFREIVGIDPFSANIATLQKRLQDYGLSNVLAANEQDMDQYLFLMMSHVIEPALAKKNIPVAVYNFPTTQAALAKIKDGSAQRFEVYFHGVELANGFHELTDVTVQSARFQQDLVLRRQQGLPTVAPDKYLLQALAYGLPPCSGVALGVDRMLALLLQQPSIAKTLAFDFTRA